MSEIILETDPNICTLPVAKCARKFSKECANNSETKHLAVQTIMNRESLVHCADDAASDLGANKQASLSGIPFEKCGQPLQRDITVESNVGSNTTTSLVIHGPTQKLYEWIKESGTTFVCSVCELPCDAHEGIEPKMFGICEIDKSEFQSAMVNGNQETVRALTDYKHSIHTACELCVGKNAHIFGNKCVVCYKRFDKFIRANSTDDNEAKIKREEYSWMMGKPLNIPASIELVDQFVQHHIHSKKIVDDLVEQIKKRTLDACVEEKSIAKKLAKMTRTIKALGVSLDKAKQDLELERKKNGAFP